MPEPRSFPRYDVWTDAGRAEADRINGDLYEIAGNLSTTAAYGLMRVLREAGWVVEMRPRERPWWQRPAG